MRSPFMIGRPRVWRETDGMVNLPRSWGAYRFRVESSRVIDYVGITSNLYRRIAQHRSNNCYYNPEIHSVEYQVARNGISWTELCQWERIKIAQHSPGLVTYAGGNGRRPAVEINGELYEVEEDESIEDVLAELGLLGRVGRVLSNIFR